MRTTMGPSRVIRQIELSKFIDIVESRFDHAATEIPAIHIDDS